MKIFRPVTGLTLFGGSSAHDPTQESGRLHPRDPDIVVPYHLEYAIDVGCCSCLGLLLTS